MLSREVSVSHSEVGEGWVCLRGGRKMTTWAAKQRRGLPGGSRAQGERSSTQPPGSKAGAVPGGSVLPKSTTVGQ